MYTSGTEAIQVFSVGGEAESRDESFGGLGQSFLIALLGVFAVLVLQFSSFKQPLIIFTAIPLSITGSFVTLLITGHSFSFMAFVGLTSLMGIVINSSIILVDEMQNLTYEEIDTVMTRVGHMSKILWCGDYRQTDLNKKRNDMSGILKFFDIAQHMKAFTRIEFTVDDIVRSSLVKDYILAKLKYEDYEDRK